jgi:hypothetical protein
MLNAPIQVSVNQTGYLPNQKIKKSKHKEGYFTSYYAKNKEKFLSAQKRYRAKLKTNKPKKNPSVFQQKKTNLLLKLLVNNRSFVPVPQKLKHPIIKN